MRHKYFDPSYLIRGSAANAADSVLSLCAQRVHAAMAGKTGLVNGFGMFEGAINRRSIAFLCFKKLDQHGRIAAATLLRIEYASHKSSTPKMRQLEINILMQNFLGMGVAAAFGMDPKAGLMAGSVSLTGGLGTTVAWAPIFTDQLGIANALAINFLANL